MRREARLDPTLFLRRSAAIPKERNHRNMLGTIVNAAAILLGGCIGLLVKKGLSKRISDTVMSCLALIVIYIGIDGSLEGQNVLVTTISMTIGAVIGSLLDLDARFDRFAHFLEHKIVKNPGEGSTFGEGFITASLLFCVGAMAVVGSLNSGLSGNHEVLFAKSLIDGITSIIFAGTLGAGVLLSAVMVFVYQGAITLLAQVIAPFLSEVVIAEMTCIGSLLIIAVGLNMLKVTKIKVMNCVLGIFIPILWYLIF